MRKTFGAAVVLLASNSWAQTHAYSISTIKPNDGNDNRIMMQAMPGGQMRMTGVTLKMLVTQAYRLLPFQVSGGPSWIDTQRWDIQAKAEDVQGFLPPEESALMLQKLLEERFGLKAHTESKEMPVYLLTVAKGGPKLKENNGTIALPPRAGMPTPPPPPGGGPGAGPAVAAVKPPAGGGGFFRMGRGFLDVSGGKMDGLARQLATNLQRVVLDKTGLTASYDFSLEWTPEVGQVGGPGGPGLGPGPVPPGDVPASPNGAPTLFTALQEQLGLRVDSSKAPVDVLMVDKAEKPTEN